MLIQAHHLKETNFLCFNVCALMFMSKCLCRWFVFYTSYEENDVCCFILFHPNKSIPNRTVIGLNVSLIGKIKSISIMFSFLRVYQCTTWCLPQASHTNPTSISFLIVCIILMSKYSLVFFYTIGANAFNLYFFNLREFPLS